MSQALASLYGQQFATNVQLLLQQKGSKLSNYVMKGNHVGKQASPVDQVGSLIMEDNPARFAPIGRQDAAVDRRWVFPVDSDLNQLVDNFDKLRIISDPQSVYNQNALFAAGRRMDDHIIAALTGTAKTGETGGTSTTLPAANQIAVTFGASGNTGLTVAKLREAKRLLMSYEVDLDNDPISAIVTADEHDDLLAESQVVSTDFNDKPVLVEGKVVRFLGINIIHCQRITTVSSNHIVPVFAKSGMYLGIWKDIVTDISQRKDLKSHPWQIYCQMTMGATRLEENKVIQIACA